MDQVEGISQEADRLAVVRIARSLKGVRFRHQGRSREFGIDCFGLPFVVAKEMGWDYPDYHSYSRQPNWVEAYYYLDKYLTRIPRSKMDVGDIPVLNEGTPHGAIVVDGYPFSLIHSSLIWRKVIETRLTDAFKIERVYRFKELWRN